MFAALVLDHRLAFLFLAALNLGTTVPLAFGWARVLPEEPPPFATAEDSLRRRRNEPPLKKLMSERRDPFAIVLLLCVTVSYACQLPGVPRCMGFDSIPTMIPHSRSGWIEFAAIWFLVLIPGFAAAYSFLRPNFLRVPLIAAGFLVLLLWLLAAPLRAALEAVSQGSARGIGSKKNGPAVAGPFSLLRDLVLLRRSLYAVAALTCPSAAATSFKSGTTGMS